MGRKTRIVLGISLAANLVLAGLALHTFNFFWELLRDDAREQTIRLQSLAEKMEYRSVDIVFAGDSLIEEGYWSYWFPDADILNLGIRGTTSYNLFNRRHQITRVEPNKVFLMVGINNLIYSNLTLDIDEAIKFYGKLIDALEREAPQARLVLHSVLPTNDDWLRVFDLDTVRPINTFLREEAGKRGHSYVDLAAYLVGANGKLDPAYSDDGLHLNASGYDIWVEKIRSEVYSSSDRGGDAVMHGIGGS